VTKVESVELRDLRLAVIASQHRSLRQAAEAISIRQSTLSRRLRDHRLGGVSPAMNSCATWRLNSMLWERCLAMAFILPSRGGCAGRRLDQVEGLHRFASFRAQNARTGCGRKTALM
jgi:hypothetical protein